MEGVMHASSRETMRRKDIGRNWLKIVALQIFIRECFVAEFRGNLAQRRDESALLFQEVQW